METVLGSWSIPGRKTAPIAGSLELGAEGAVLHVVGSFGGSVRSRRQTWSYPVLNGTDRSGRELTLLDCFAVAGPGWSNQDIHISTVLVGKSIQSSGLYFRGMVLGLSHIHEWAHGIPRALGVPATVPIPGGDAIAVAQPEDGATVAIVSANQDWVDARGRHSQELVSLSLLLPKAISIENLETRHVRVLQDLITFLTGRPNYVERCAYLWSPPRATPEQEWMVEVRKASAWHRLGERAPIVHWSNMLLPAHHDVFRFSQLVTEWYRLYARLEPTLSSLLSFDQYAPAPFAEPQFLALVQAAEGIHRELFPTTAADKAGHQEATARILAATAASGKDRKLLRRALKYAGEPSLSQRLRQLAGHVGPALTPLLDANPLIFNDVERVRNLMAHQLKPTSAWPYPDPSRVQLMTRILRFLVQGTLLRELGLQEDELRWLFFQWSEYSQSVRESGSSLMGYV